MKKRIILFTLVLCSYFTSYANDIVLNKAETTLVQDNSSIQVINQTINKVDYDTEIRELSVFDLPNCIHFNKKVLHYKYELRILYDKCYLTIQSPRGRQHCVRKVDRMQEKYLKNIIKLHFNSKDGYLKCHNYWFETLSKYQRFDIELDVVVDFNSKYGTDYDVEYEF